MCISEARWDQMKPFLIVQDIPLIFPKKLGKVQADSDLASLYVHCFLAQHCKTVSPHCLQLQLWAAGYQSNVVNYEGWFQQLLRFDKFWVCDV